jgi:uncharacterized protein (TIGR02145 family)
MRSRAALLLLSIALLSSAYAQDTVQVYKGWNIIGSVKAGAVPDVLTTIPGGIITTSLYGYNPEAGYQSADTLGKGSGYWVKVSSDGVIIFNSSGECGVKRVVYGGISYGTVRIGSQCWLGENLNVGTMIAGATPQTDNATLEKYCYNDDPVNCGVYGGLYVWDEAMQYTITQGAKGICPTGWHIPTLGEFETLQSTVGDDGNAIKQGGVGTDPGLGTNTTGFSALLGGNSFTGSFIYLGSRTVFWSTTETTSPYVNCPYLDYGTNIIAFQPLYSKLNGFSVRCLEE